MYHSQKLWHKSLLTLWGLAFFLLPTQEVSAKIPLGLPSITHYQFEEIPVENFVKGVILDDNGILYVSLTNGGIGAYDGVSWRQVEIPADIAPSIRPWSFAKGADGRVYVAAVRDFGYLAPNEQGIIQYISLRKQLLPPEEQEVKEVRRVHATEQGIYFKLLSKLIRWSPWDGTLKTWDAKDGEFRSSWLVGDQLYVWESGRGLLRMDDENLVLIPDGERFANGIVHVILPYDDQRLLVGDTSQRFFLYDGTRFQPFSTELDGILTSLSWPGAVLPDGNFALNTLGQGIFIIDRQGKLIQQLDHRTGLTGDSVETFYLDSHGTLWALFGLLGNIIDRIETSSPFTWYDHSHGIGQFPNLSIEFQDTLYIGKGLGFVYWDKVQHTFQMVPGSEGIEDVYHLREINGQLFLAGYIGIYQLQDGQAVPILKRATGSSDIQFLHPDARDENLVFAAASNGIELLRRDNGSLWQAAGRIKGFDKFVQNIVEDEQHRLWLSTDEPVVYRLSFPEWPSLESPVVDKFEIAPGLSSDTSFWVSFVNGQLVSTSDHGIFVWDETAQQFQRDLRFGEDAAYIVPDLEGRFWVMSKGKRHLRLAIPQPDGTYQIEKTLFQPLADKKILHIQPDAEDNLVWFSTYEGLIRYDRSIQSVPSFDFKTLIREVHQGDTLLYGGDGPLLNNNQLFTHIENNFQFVYAAPFPGYEQYTRYQTRLEGFDSGWSPWQKRTSREYTNLPPGNYRFQVKALNIYGLQRDSEVFSFTIDFPWYQRSWAYLLYGLVVFIVFWEILQIRTARLRQQRGKLKALVEEQTQDLLIARDEAEAARIRAEKANRTKSTFLSNMSHELRTPLNAILGMTEGLQDKVLGQINIQQLKALQTIERSGVHLLEMINDILDLAKVESGLVDLDYSPVAVTHLCKSSLAFVREQALKKHIQLHQKVPSNLPDIVVDERRIRQILINLLNNAVKFTPEEGHITLEVVPLLQDKPRNQNYVRFAVSDTGIGIAPDDLKKLFQPFVQIDSALNRQYEGTGLGLVLVKQITELHGGQIAVTSEVGVGSCFVIELPYIISELSNLTSKAMLESNSATFEIEQSTVAPLILLVEDNDANIVTLSSYLRAKGYRIQVVKDGQAAIEVAQAESPNIILMDIHLPGMDGLVAIQHIRQLPALAEIPIIALTALAMKGDRERCLEAGANTYLSKPVKLKQLILSIQKLLSP
ncbi:signal transduction histidine kinase [Leptolyngbya sp. PCC 7375]|nr:signal transduction histidine kinase [Leptolyngbya sp. PCC 7375]